MWGKILPVLIMIEWNEFVNIQIQRLFGILKTWTRTFIDSENMDKKPIGNSFATGSYKCLSISSDYYSYCSGFQIYSSVMHGNKWKIMLAVWKNIHSAINCFLNSWILYTGIFCTGLWLNRQKVCLNVIV
jgi:hypothetical protein